MNWLFPAIIATLLSTLVLLLIYLYLYYRYRERAMLIWSLAWAFYFFRFVFSLLNIVWISSHLILIANQISSLISSYLLLWGTYVFFRRRMSVLWTVLSLLIALWICLASFTHFSFLVVSLPTFTFLGFIMIMMGYLSMRYMEVSRLMRYLLGLNFILWGIHKFDYPFLKTVIWFAPWGYIMGAFFAMVTAIGMILVYFERAREELTQSEEKFRQLAENLQEVFWLITPDWGRVIYISPSYEKVWERPCESLYRDGSSWMTNLHDEDRGRVMETIASVDFSSGDPVIFPEYRIITDNGDVRWIYARAFPVRNARGEVYRVAGIAEDITARKMAQEYMLHAEKMVTVGGLAAGMAHEINNPLGIITLALDTIEKKLNPAGKGNAEHARRFGINLEMLHDYFRDGNILALFESMRDSTHRAARIIRTMLDFSRKKQEKSDAGLREMIEDAVAFAGRDYELNNKYKIGEVSFRYSFDEDAVSVPCIRMQIEQVLLNIIKNAVQAMWGPGMEDRPRVITITAKLEENDVVIEISDTGPGMDEEQQRRIFEPFYTTKNVGEGTGLGLFVSYFIVTENHGGTISVRSGPGEGTTFRLSLPASD